MDDDLENLKKELSGSSKVGLLPPEKIVFVWFIIFFDVELGESCSKCLSHLFMI